MPSRTPRRVARALLAAALAAGCATVLVTAAPTQARLSDRRSWQVAPGVTYRSWGFWSSAGPERIHLLEVDPTTPGISIGYRINATLQTRRPASSIVGGDPTAVGGTNANFFDIGDTNAPLGIGSSPYRGVTHAPASGWNNAFYETADGSYHVGPLGFAGQVHQYPGWPVSGLNLPRARPNAITVYTPVWGSMPSREVVLGHPAVREVQVVDGVVTRNSARLTPGARFHGLLLVGVRRGAQLLAEVPVGSDLNVSWALRPQPLMAVTGSQVLVQGGRVLATDGYGVAPRTAIGITSGGDVVLAALDGREKDAVGLSLRAWAACLKGLGVQDAINLDGGGSTTMVARTRGADRVVNQPSEGHQRWVPDALTVDYQRPQ